MPVVFFLLLNSQWSWQFQCTDAFLNTFTTHQTTMLWDGRKGRPPSQSMGKDGNETQKWIFLINGTFNCIVKLQNILPVFRIYVTQVIDNYIWRIFAKSVHVSANELIWYIYIWLQHPAKNQVCNSQKYLARLSLMLYNLNWRHNHQGAEKHIRISDIGFCSQVSQRGLSLQQSLSWLWQIVILFNTFQEMLQVFINASLFNTGTHLTPDTGLIDELSKVWNRIKDQ